MAPFRLELARPGGACTAAKQTALQFQHLCMAGWGGAAAGLAAFRSPDRQLTAALSAVQSTLSGVPNGLYSQPPLCYRGISPGSSARLLRLPAHNGGSVGPLKSVAPALWPRPRFTRPPGGCEVHRHTELASGAVSYPEPALRGLCPLCMGKNERRERCCPGKDVHVPGKVEHRAGLLSETLGDRMGESDRLNERTDEYEGVPLSKRARPGWH
ncbi:hypothetical protein SKAU_G00270260 [Synaphobranchus kaupii]|uniref:Uncharacterized protein n=1 Tax=Synaphobranchus kaupii TaxID=118154 RepID=A0A9Q1IQ93_SYNKA|nr:hypothetical protein SKAU_G00270260 [Synaphobranchus kaupii]